jgi:hypothetical protein
MTNNAVEKKKEVSLDKPTEEVKFKPTPHMMVWLDTALQLDTDNVTEIAQACSQDRTNWYDWQKKEGFIEWFNAEWDKRLKGHAWKLDVIGMKNAKRDFNYWKAMQNRAGRLEDKGSNTAVQINFNSDKYVEEVEG